VPRRFGSLAVSVTPPLIDQSGRLDRGSSDEPRILYGFSAIIPVASNPSILS
jgi:hypothetical protein